VYPRVLEYEALGKFNISFARELPPVAAAVLRLATLHQSLSRFSGVSAQNGSRLGVN